MTAEPVEHGASRRTPDSPTEVPPSGWLASLKRTAKEFQEDNLTDWAAALTYYAVLALFPALLVLVALLGLVGQYPQTTNALLDIVGKLGPSSEVDTFRKPIEGVVRIGASVTSGENMSSNSTSQKIGGESGIRTHDTLVAYTRSPGVRLRPLGHLSVSCVPRDERPPVRSIARR